jgi:hypothetical protein
MRKEQLHVVVASAAYVVVIAAVAMINLCVRRERNIPRQPSTYRRLHRNANIQQFLYGSADSCLAYVRMGPHAFLNLAQMLRDNRSLRDSVHVTVEEQLAYFLHIIGHGERNRIVRTFFYRSTKTISVYVRRVLRAIHTLKSVYIKAPSTAIHPKIASNRNWFPYFKVWPIHLIKPLRPLV